MNVLILKVNVRGGGGGGGGVDFRVFLSNAWPFTHCSGVFWK